MEINDLMGEISQSKKYANLSQDLIERVCRETVKKYSNKKTAISEAKKELHIIYESFLTKNCQSIAKEKILTYAGSDILSDKGFSSELLQLHISTKERLGYEEEIYSYICQFISQDCLLTDVGCGFNPLALPYFVKKPTKYIAYEISNDTVDVLNTYFSIAKANGYSATILDAVCESPPVFSDILLAFKLLPLLQQQKKGRAMEFLNVAPFAIAVVSFPIKSLSGKSKGMEAFYTSFLESNLPKEISVYDRTILYNELFYVLKK